jgi:hypothetical protein
LSCGGSRMRRRENISAFSPRHIASTNLLKISRLLARVDGGKARSVALMNPIAAAF